MRDAAYVLNEPPAILAAVAAVLGTIGWLAGVSLRDTDDALAQTIVFGVLIGYPVACVAAGRAAVVMGRRPRLAAALLLPAAGVLIFPILVPGLVAATAGVLALMPTPAGKSNPPSEGWQRRDIVRALVIGIGGLAALMLLVLLLYVLAFLSSVGD